MPTYQNWHMDWFERPGFAGSTPAEGTKQEGGRQISPSRAS
jgi:hypothetical protein